MPTTISRSQQSWMAILATLFAATDVACAVLAIRNRFGRGGIDPEFNIYLVAAVFFSCTLVAAVVAGICIGGTVTCVWRSPPGRYVFAASGCGFLGSVLATFASLHFIVHDGPVSVDAFRSDTMIAGGVILGGTVLGLIAGWFYARRVPSKARSHG